MNIELHADDFGATPSVNRNIVSAWLKGGVDGVSVLANGDAVSEAAAEVNSYPDRQLRIVAHLNLSESEPTAAASDVPLLLGDNGKLKFGFMGLWLNWLRSDRDGKRALETQIECEWRAQIEAVQKAFLPRKVSGVDGHIHVQMLPFTFPIAAKLASELGLDQIRISNEVRHFSIRDSNRIGCAANVLKHQLLRMLAKRARPIALEYGLVAPDAVAGLLYSGRMSRSAIESASAAAQKIGLGWLEVICHPGRAEPADKNRWDKDSGLAAFYSSPDRDFEFATMISFAAERNKCRKSDQRVV